MYVCICTGVTSDEIVDKIKSGHNTLDALMMEIGVGLGCRVCVGEIEKIIMSQNECKLKENDFPLKVFNC